MEAEAKEVGAQVSSAAKKAWATRRKKSPKKWGKRQKWVGQHTDATCYIVKNGRVEAIKESALPRKGETVYYSTFEAEQVAKHGSQWFQKRRR